MDLNRCLQVRRNAFQSYARSRNKSENPYAMTPIATAIIITVLFLAVLEFGLMFAYGLGWSCDGFLWIYTAILFVMVILLGVFTKMNRVRENKLENAIQDDKQKRLEEVQKSFIDCGLFNRESLELLRDEAEQRIKEKQHSAERTLEHVWSMAITGVFGSVVSLVIGLVRNPEDVNLAFIVIFAAAVFVLLLVFAWSALQGVIEERSKISLSELRGFRDDVTSILLEGCMVKSEEPMKLDRSSCKLYSKDFTVFQKLLCREYEDDGR